MRTASTIAVLPALLSLVATSTNGQVLCNGDTPPVYRSDIFRTGDSSARIESKTGMVHFFDHPSCHGNGGNLSTTARLYSVFGEDGCPFGNDGSHTNSIAGGSCTRGAGEYSNHGEHFFDGTRIGESVGCCVVLPGALFALAGAGSMFWVGWPLHDDDRWLALDRNGNRWIDDASELLGTATPLAGGGYAKHGYEALAELDENGDGQIDTRDTAYPALLLWGDTNRNGLSEPDELMAVASTGITTLSLEFQESPRVDGWGNRFALRSHARVVSPSRTWSLKVVDVFPLVRRAVP